MKTIYFLSLLGLFLCLNFYVIPISSSYDTQRLFQVSTVIFLAIYYMFLKYGSERAPVVLCPLIVLFMLGSLVFTNAYSTYPYLGFLDTANTLFLLFSLFLFAQPWLRSGDIMKFEEAIVLLISVGLFVYFYQMLIIFFLGLSDGPKPDEGAIVHHMSNKRFLNHLQVLTFPLLLVFSLRSQFQIQRRLCFCVAVLSISILFFLSARAAIASLFISTLIILFLLPDRGLLRRCLLVAIVGFLFFMLFFKGLPALIYGLSEVPMAIKSHSSGRWALWAESLLLLKEHWLLGVGGMQYGYWSQLGFGHPHNLVLQIALEYGVPVLLIVLFFVGRFLMRLTRMLRENQFSSFQVGCYWAFVATLGVAMFSGVWVAPLTQLLLVMIVAPLIGPYVSSYEAPQPANKAIKLKLPGWSLKFVLLLMIIYFVVLLFNEIERHHESIDYSTIEKPLYAPRFWQESTWPKLKANDS